MTASASPASLPPTTSRRCNWWEFGAVVATAVVHLLPLEQLYPEIIEIVVLAAGWLGYVVWRIRRDPGVAAHWGFRRAGWKPTAVWLLVAAVVGVAVLAGIGLALHGSLLWHWHMLVLLALYPLWGLTQQLLVQGLVVGNLRLLRHRFWSSPWLLIPLAAVLFGLVHAPEWPLVAATFTLGLVVTPLWLRWRNLWPLGIAHGWLAVPMYFFVLRINPLARALSASGTG